MDPDTTLRGPGWTPPSLAGPVVEDPYVYRAVIVLGADGTHEASVLAAVRAVLLARTRHPGAPQWLAWDAAGPSTWVLIATARDAQAIGEQLPHATAAVGGSTASTWIPIMSRHVPVAVRSLPEGRVDLPRGAWPAGDGRQRIAVVIDESRGLTTTEAARQAVHAVLSWLRGQAGAHRLEMPAAGACLAPPSALAVGADARQFARLAASAIGTADPVCGSPAAIVVDAALIQN